jgi:hypothetical protein
MRRGAQKISAPGEAWFRIINSKRGTDMKSTKLALATVLLFGTLSACNKPEPAAPAEAEPAAAEPSATPAPAPAVPEATDTTTPAPTEPPPADGEETDDTPHSGGDKVGTRPGN